MREIIAMAIPAALLSIVPLFFIAMGMHSLVRSVKKNLEKERVELMKEAVREVFWGPQEQEDEDTQPLFLAPVIHQMQLEEKKKTDELLKTENALQTFQRMRKQINSNV